MKSGYWQIKMAGKDKCKTALTTHVGLFEFNVMPFGLTNAQNRYVIAYLDDVIVFSETFQEHMEHLHDVFQRLVKAGLKLKRS